MSDELQAATNAATLQIQHHYVETAKFSESKAVFEASTARLQMLKAEEELKVAQMITKRVRNANRPSIIMGATITVDDSGHEIEYIARAGGVEATGTTPEIAFQNFDRLWSQGDDDE